MADQQTIDLWIVDANKALLLKKYEEAWGLAEQIILETRSEKAKEVCLGIISEWSADLIASDPGRLKSICNSIKAWVGDEPKWLIVLLRIYLKGEFLEEIIPLYDIIKTADSDFSEARVALKNFYAQKKALFGKMVNEWRLKGDATATQAGGANEEFANQAQILGNFYYFSVRERELGMNVYDLALKWDPENYRVSYGLGDIYDCNEEYEKALECYKKAFQYAKSDDDRTDCQAAIARQYDGMQKYQDALEQYQKILKSNQGDVYARHNEAVLYEKIGDFKSASISWDKTIALYKAEQKKNNFSDEPDKLFFYAEALFDFKKRKSIHEFEEIEDLYKEYEKTGPDPEDVYYPLAVLYSDKRRAILDQEVLQSESEEIRNMAIDDAHFHFMRYFRLGIRDLECRQKEPLSEIEKRNNFCAIGELYLLVDYYEEAEVQFSKSIEIDNRSSRALSGKGVCQFRQGHYLESVRNFKKSLEFAPEDLNLICNLADAYRKSGNLDLANTIYNKVLVKSPLFTDAKIGLAECYKSAGDISNENKDKDEADVNFSKSKNYFQTILTDDVSSSCSKVLSGAEKNQLYYSLGYTKVRLYENGESDTLQSAVSDFKKVLPNSEVYYKAKKAIRSINERKESQEASLHWIQPLIFILSALLFLGAQIYAVGKYFEKDIVYKISRPAFISYSETALSKEDKKTVLNKMALLYGHGYKSMDEANGQLDSILPDSISLLRETDKMIVKEEIPSKASFEKAFYSVITFTSLLFMIVGLFLPSLTKLKVGSVEMEKNTIDTVKTTRISIIS